MAYQGGDKQCSDAAQTGPGVTTGLKGSIPVPPRKSAPSISPSGNTSSGTSQSSSRGPQGWGS